MSKKSIPAYDSQAYASNISARLSTAEIGSVVGFFFFFVAISTFPSITSNTPELMSGKGSPREVAYYYSLEKSKQMHKC